jgi:hypothetical protein
MASRQAPAQAEGIHRGRGRLTATQAAELARTTEPEWLALVRGGRAPRPDGHGDFHCELGYQEWWYRATLDIWTTRQAAARYQPAGPFQETARNLLHAIADLAEAAALDVSSSREPALERLSDAISILLDRGDLTAWARTLLLTFAEPRVNDRVEPGRQPDVTSGERHLPRARGRVS